MFADNLRGGYVKLVSDFSCSRPPLHTTGWTSVAESKGKKTTVSLNIKKNLKQESNPHFLTIVTTTVSWCIVGLRWW